MKITAETEEEFISKLDKLLNMEVYSTIKSIVYFWKVEKPIPRVIGTSNLLYIGQTSKSLSERYLPKRAMEIERANFSRFYKRIFKEYGALSIEIVKTTDPKRTEWDELKKYYDKHFDYPPLNRNIPNEPKNYKNA